jgi:cytochrome c2
MRLAALSFVLLLAGCEKDPAVENGRLLLRQFGCGSCHEIPGVAAAEGRVGPPLDGIARRVYLGGVLPNSPENMARFIRRPQEIDPRTAMPDMGVTEAHARDMVAYLYTLK